MGKSKFHIDIHGKPAPCKAQKNCPRGGPRDHFSSFYLAQQAADKRNELKAKKEVITKTEKLPELPKVYNLKTVIDANAPIKYGTTKTDLLKQAKVGEILETKAYNKRMLRLNDALGKIIEKDIPRAYKQLVEIQKKQGLKKTSYEKFYKDFTNNDEDFKMIREKKNELQKDILKLKDQREQSVKIFKDNKHNIIDKSFSKASGSTYIIYKAESLEETIHYYEQQGYEIEVRSDIKSALEENFLVRISDHYPKNYLRDDKEEKDPFNYTDASILIKFKEPSEKIKNTHGNAIQAIRDIEKLDREVTFIK